MNREPRWYKIPAGAAVVFLPSVARAHGDSGHAETGDPLEYAGLLLLTYSPVILPAAALLIKFLRDRRAHKE